MTTMQTGWIIEHSGAGSLPDADAWADRVLVRLGGVEAARAAYLAVADGDPTWDNACREALRDLCADWAALPECMLVPSGWEAERAAAQSDDQRILDDIAEALPEHDLRDLDGVDETSSTSAKLRAVAALVGLDMLREAAARVSEDAARLVEAAQDD